jgi:hypothetical protein
MAETGGLGSDSSDRIDMLIITVKSAENHTAIDSYAYLPRPKPTFRLGWPVYSEPPPEDLPRLRRAD